jgi:NAD(P)H-dependent flavin oxidoreductase YrpB (nitropropane dioxygenase family)
MSATLQGLKGLDTAEPRLTNGSPHLKTALCERLGIRYPIFGFSHSVDVTVALANAGCFPIYGATRDLPEQIVSHLAEIRERVGAGRFGVDLLLPSGVGTETDRAAVVAGLPAEHKKFVDYLRTKYQVPAATQSTFFSSQIRSQQLFAEQIDAVLGSGADAFAAGIGSPQATIERARQCGKLTISLVGSAKHARAAKAAGVDLIVAQGADAGGHTGPVGTFSLVPQVVEVAGEIPVLAAGGVGHGRQIAAAFALGAQGAWLGTAWLTSSEHALGDVLLRKILAARAEDTVISRSHSGKAARLIRSAWSDEWDAASAPSPLNMPFHQVLTGELLAAVHEHRIEALAYEGAGQGVGWYNELKPVGEIVERLVGETREALRTLCGRLRGD